MACRTGGGTSCAAAGVLSQNRVTCGNRVVGSCGVGTCLSGAAPRRGCRLAPGEGNPMAKTVLAVEHKQLKMNLFPDILEAPGYGTLGPRNGIEALALARKHRPDLILMDIQLPEVSGLEVTKWLKDDPELKAIPVVAVTAFA